MTNPDQKLHKGNAAIADAVSERSNTVRENPLRAQAAELLCCAKDCNDAFTSRVSLSSGDLNADQTMAQLDANPSTENFAKLADTDSDAAVRLASTDGRFETAASVGANSSVKGRVAAALGHNDFLTG